MRYYRCFLELTNPLRAAHKLTDEARNSGFLKGFHRDDRDILSHCLYSLRPNHPQGLPYELDDAFRVAKGYFSNEQFYCQMQRRLRDDEDESDSNSGSDSDSHSDNDRHDPRHIRESRRHAKPHHDRNPCRERSWHDSEPHCDRDSRDHDSHHDWDQHPHHLCHPNGSCERDTCHNRQPQCYDCYWDYSSECSPLRDSPAPARTVRFKQQDKD